MREILCQLSFSNKNKKKAKLQSLFLVFFLFDWRVTLILFLIVIVEVYVLGDFLEPFTRPQFITIGHLLIINLRVVLIYDLHDGDVRLVLVHDVNNVEVVQGHCVDTLLVLCERVN